MIQSFRCKDTDALLNDVDVLRFRSVERVAHRKRLLLEQALKLDDLKSPPGNRLEMPKGNRKGQHSIRVNDQWRICFAWRGNEATRVEIVDYHEATRHGEAIRAHPSWRDPSRGISDPAA